APSSFSSQRLPPAVCLVCSSRSPADTPAWRRRRRSYCLPARTPSAPSLFWCPRTRLLPASTYGGSLLATSTQAPSGADTVGTVLLLVPASSVSISGVSSYTTVTSTYTGETLSISTAAPSGADTLGTVIFFQPSATASSQLLPTDPASSSAGSTAGSSAGSSAGVLPNIFTTVTSGYAGSVTQTTTLLPDASDVSSIGTVLVQVPQSALPTDLASSSADSIAGSTAGSSAGSSAGVLPAIFTTVTSGYTGSVTQTTTLLPDASDISSIGTVLVQVPQSALPTDPASSSAGSAAGSSAGPSAGALPNIFTTVTSGYAGSIIQTTTLLPGPSDISSIGTVLVQIPHSSAGPSAGSSAGVLPNIFTTVTSGYAGSIIQTTTLLPGPSDISSIGTVLVQVPQSALPTDLSSSPTAAYTTIFSTGTGDAASTTTIEPSSNDPLGVGTVIVNLPSGLATSSPTNSVSVVYTTIVSFYSGSDPATTTFDPAAGDSIGTVLIQVPLTASSGASPSSSIGIQPASYVTVTSSGGFIGLGPATTTIPPANSGDAGTVVVQLPDQTLASGILYTTVTSGYDGLATLTSSLPLATVGGSPVQTVLVQVPTASVSSGILFTTVTSGYAGSVTQTSSLPLGTVNGSPVQTVLVQVPSATGALDGQYTTLTSGYPGSVVTTQTGILTGADGLVTVLVLSPTAISSPAATSTSGLFVTITSGYGGSITATSTGSVTGVDGLVTVVVQTPSASVLPGLSYTTVTSGYDGGYAGSVVQTLFGSSTGIDGLATVVVQTPTASVLPGLAYTTVTSGYSGSAVQTLIGSSTGVDGLATVLVQTPT
ncbi:hypothetical protein LX36DRAFT_547507, partial [Colletotrichum falcatum]